MSLTELKMLSSDVAEGDRGFAVPVDDDGGSSRGFPYAPSSTIAPYESGARGRPPCDEPQDCVERHPVDGVGESVGVGEPLRLLAAPDVTFPEAHAAVWA